MAAQELGPDRIAFGKNILEQLDKNGFNAIIAMWVYNTDAEEWILMVASHEAAIKGSQEAFLSLLNCIESSELRTKIQTQRFRVGVYDPRKSLFTLYFGMLGCVGKIGETAEVYSGGNIFNGVLLPTAYIYRLIAPDRAKIVAEFQEKAASTDETFYKTVLIEALIDKSNWELMQGDIEKAETTFHHAEEIATEKEVVYSGLRRKLDNFRKTLAQASNKRNAS